MVKKGQENFADSLQTLKVFALTGFVFKLRPAFFLNFCFYQVVLTK